MNTIIERITEAIKDILIGLIKSCLDNMFTSVNEQVGTIAGQVGQTPQGWNAGIFNLIQNISQTVIVPIAGLIITFVLCYELITMVTQKNNFHEFETYNIFLWIFKAYVAIYLVTNTFNITMAVFDVGQHVVNNAAGVISGNTAVDASEAITRIVDALEDMELGDLFLLSMDTLLISIFGGLINGFVIGLCLHMNATTGGTDFIAIYLSEKKEIDSWNVVLGINVVILAAAGVLFGWDKALYSIIFQYTSTQVVHILYRKYQHETLFIVTNKATEVYEVISKMSNHGATIMEGEGSYEHQERKIVYSVVSSAQSKSIIREVKKADPHAFVNAIKTEQIAGRFYQKPNE